MNKKQAVLLTVVGLVAILLAFMDTKRLWFRLDLTEGKAYTISRASKELFKEIEERVTITYYLSEKLSKVHPVPAEIKDLLREYAAFSRGRIRVVFQDPVKTGTVAAAERLGILPQQIQTVEKDQSSVATVYTGIVVEYLDRTEAIPVAFSLDTLEYDLTTRIRTVVRGTSRELGILVADSAKSWEKDFPYLARALDGAGFKTRTFAAGEALPQALSALLVLGGAADLDDWLVYRIDAYVRSGGRAFFAVDGVSVDSSANLEARPVGKSPLLDLLEAYGAKVSRELVLDRAALTLPFQTRSPGGGLQMRLIRYPHWVALLDRYSNRSHPVTARFGGLDLFWPSPVTAVPVAGVQSAVLASTTPESWRMTKDFTANPEMEMLFQTEAATTKGSYPLVLALSGAFPSPYAGKPKPVREGSSDVLPDLPPVPSESRLVVVGDADFATTLIQYTRSERNLDFLLNASDWLSNDDDVLSIRPRAGRDTRLDAIADPDERARAGFAAKMTNVVFVPLGVVAFAIFRALRRRKMQMSVKGENDELSA
ncbi:MAG: ABC transporter [Treponema sp. GWA1_62_8]|nr:MAG: ABC transporter [Treponema sp. GWA1_62_8]